MVKDVSEALLCRLHFALLAVIVRDGHAPRTVGDVLAAVRAAPAHVLGESAPLDDSDDTLQRQCAALTAKDAPVLLRALQEYHGVVCHPCSVAATTTEAGETTGVAATGAPPVVPLVWTVHPFMCAPTGFSVRWPGVGCGQWWGTCAWCSLGVAAALLEAAVPGKDERRRDARLPPITIRTSLGSDQDTPVEIVIDPHNPDSIHVRILQQADDDSGTFRWCDADADDFGVHFPVPMTAAWDNVTYTCSVMLLFRVREPDGADSSSRSAFTDTDASSSRTSEASPQSATDSRLTSQLESWCARSGVPRGDVRPLGSVVWPFARRWYGQHLKPKWRKWRLHEAASIFKEFGLDGPTWWLPSTTGQGDANF